jgi:enamine deaminase RidA (YjgF/YER057c/UK114 family)
MSKVNIRKKLKEMGLEIPVAAIPLAAYVPAVKTGKLVFTAGQLPMVNGAIPITGKVGAEVSVEQAKELAQICALNALAALNLVADVDDVARIVRVVGYVNGAPGFVNLPAVVNGASELLLALWGDVNGKHARSALGVAELPLNSPVEVELTFELKKK